MNEESVTVEQIFLQKGHTMMEADNVHLVLEHYFKPPIYYPSDYVSRMQVARPKQPYNIKNGHFNFFLNYENLNTNLTSLRPEKKVGDPVITDLRALKYLPSGDIFYKLDQSRNWLELLQRCKTGYVHHCLCITDPLPCLTPNSGICKN